MEEPNEFFDDGREHDENRPQVEGATPDERRVSEEEAQAAREAARIGGRSGMEDMDPAERAAAEHGGGVAEGFEQAEERLVESASHGEGRHADPLADAGEPESARPRAEYAEGDHVESTETDEDTQGTPGDYDGSADRDEADGP
jgi:hypothetical protein